MLLPLVAAGCGEREASEPLTGLKADVVAEGTPVVGPVLHGDTVAWGEQAFGDDDESVSIRVMAASPGRATRQLYRVSSDKGVAGEVRRSGACRRSRSRRLAWATMEIDNVTKECNSINGHVTCSKHYSGPTTIYEARLG